MSSNEQPATCDHKASVIRLALEPLTRIFKNEVSFVLVVILCVLGGCIYWLAIKAEGFAREEIPKHIHAINTGHRDVADQFSAELKLTREHYKELRKLDREEVDRIERLATGKKTASANPATPTNE